MENDIERTSDSGSSQLARRRILIVEDEAAILKGLQFNFEQEGYAVELARDGVEALERFRRHQGQLDLIILDLMLPGKSGYEACREIREVDNDIPILVLSARTLSEDKAMAFDCGSDQYMTKPFALPELLSRARNLIDRYRRVADRGEFERVVNVVEFGNVRINFDTFSVKVGDESFSLTTMEQQLLRYFVENEGVVLSRPRILEDVWGESTGITTRSIDNFVMRLRKIIEPNSASPVHLTSLRGTGYRFTLEPEPEK